jgi:predicted secreted protein
MPAVSANTATFTWNTAALGQLESISDVTINGAEIDVSTMGANAYREFIGGKYDWSLTIGVLLNRTAHTTIMTDFLARTARTLSLDLVDGKIQGSGVVTALSASGQQDDAMRATITIRGVGAMTYAA